MELISRNTTSVNLIKDHITHPITFFDVGCSGGIDEAWHIFEDKLIAYGFDPVVDEIKRLNREKKSEQYHYIDAFVVGDSIKTMAAVDFWPRLAMVISNEIAEKKKNLHSSFKKALEYNIWQKLETTENKIYLPDFIKQNQLTPNFIKIDVDGPDFDILASIEETLQKPEVLGVCMEVNYNGGHTDDVNTFHNVDRFLRKIGFQLFDFTKRKYSLAALPAPYVITIPAQSSHGRPLQGDAVYFKDLIEMEKLGQIEVTTDIVLKQASLFSLFNQKDSCAELLLHFKDLLPKGFNLDAILNQLVQELEIEDFKNLSYKDVIKLFNKDHKIFYP